MNRNQIPVIGLSRGSSVKSIDDLADEIQSLCEPTVDELDLDEILEPQEETEIPPRVKLQIKALMEKYIIIHDKLSQLTKIRRELTNTGKGYLSDLHRLMKLYGYSEFTMNDYSFNLSQPGPKKPKDALKKAVDMTVDDQTKSRIYDNVNRLSVGPGKTQSTVKCTKKS